MHAATLAWAYIGEPRLREKLDYAAAELVKAQEADGYLGTYVPDKRFGLYQGSDWDVWSHKYNLIGLLTYYQYTGNEDALGACRKLGDLLVKTFGPDKKSIISAGTHVGMAATSVLEPMVLLYRFTGDQRYLEFSQYLVKSWDEPKGPKIVQALLTEKQVNKTANAKAYEMLSNLVGLCELARATGDRKLLEPCLIAWQDIVPKRLYITGSASQGEHFKEDYELPNQTSAHVGETCVTTTWIQFNLQLLRLTGEARFANELEKTLYNHLAAAQHPRGDDWCYFTSLEGKKPYDPGINCCHSSGPRGMSLASAQAYLRYSRGGDDALAVSTFESSSANLQLGGAEVRVEQKSEFPFKGRSELVIHPSKSARFAVLVRAAPWMRETRLEVNGRKVTPVTQDGWALISPREWSGKERVRVEFDLEPRVVMGEHGNFGKAVLQHGPGVFAYDQALNPELPVPSLVAFADQNGARIADKRLPNLQAIVPIKSPRFEGTRRATLVPFADAGASGSNYRVWLYAPGAMPPIEASLLADGTESRSRRGNVSGSINDGDRETFVVTFDAKHQHEDWFAVTVDQPVRVARIAFTHGDMFHDGGWFDTSRGKPQVQVQRSKNGSWETVAELVEYPATTSQDRSSVAAGRAFIVTLDQPLEVLGVRVVGRPASGDNPQQAFSSCAELQAFDK
jgi:DUF1680 family protein